MLASSILIAAPQYELKLSKHKVYVGEPITVTPSLLNSEHAEIIKIKYSKLKIQECEIIPISKNKYIIMPQISGKIRIKSQKLEIAQKDRKTYRNIWQTLHSQPETIDVLPLPEGIEVAGDFYMSSQIDANTTEPNKPINLTVTISGEGSLKTMKKLELDIKDTIIFTTTPSVATSIKNDKLITTLKQSFSIISTKSFEIPAILWRYQNTQTKLVETLTTRPYNIEIPTYIDKKSLILNLLALIIGIVLGISAMWINILKKAQKSSSGSIYTLKKLKKIKKNRELYALLLPFADDEKIAEILAKIENKPNDNPKKNLNKNQIKNLSKVISRYL